MRRLLSALCFFLAATVAGAEEAPGAGLDHAALRERSLAVLERQFGAFRDRTAELAAAAESHCDAGASRADVERAFRAAWLAWAPLDSYQFGPVERSAAALSVNFWPDKKNFVGRGLRALMAQPEDAQRLAGTVAEGSAAAQGFPALERLLYGDLPECPAIVGISAHLAMRADALYEDWFAADGWADVARAAGPENPVYLSQQEFTKTLFTALDFGLFRVSDQRLARPLGTWDRSFPTRAEAWRAGMTGDLIAAQLDGIALLLDEGFGPEIDDADRAHALQTIARAEELIERIGMPVDAAVKDPQTRLRVEAVQTAVRQLRAQLAEVIGPSLDVDTGFSPADGD